jgi:hypothetical protein
MASELSAHVAIAPVHVHAYCIVNSTLMQGTQNPCIEAGDGKRQNMDMLAYTCPPREQLLLSCH